MAMSSSSSSQLEPSYMRSNHVDSVDSSNSRSNSNLHFISNSSIINNNNVNNNNNGNPTYSNTIQNPSSPRSDQNNNPPVSINNPNHRSPNNNYHHPSSVSEESLLNRNLGPMSTMSNSRRDFFEELRNGGGHWSQLLRQVVLRVPASIEAAAVANSTHNMNGGGDDDGTGSDSVEESLKSNIPMIPLQILGGSENGHFAYVGIINSDINIWISVGYLQPGDIILDIQGQQVAGYTQADVLSLLHHCLQQLQPATLTVAPRGSLGPELRSYLNTRFQKGSVDHALQGVVRDNLYLRTVPVTTRHPRPGEIPGVDYTFLTVEEFMDLERNGSLLESGIYAGNHYGTPKPWASKLKPSSSTFNNIGASTNENRTTILPGMHPSSEGKRRRNRSNVEALGACDDEQSSPNPNTSSALPAPMNYSSRVQPSDELGPLPNNWEMSYTEKGEVYFIDHNTGTSHWLDPRLSRVQKQALEDCADNELPFGWERIDDPHYGTYYIDHVNRRTQFENPVIQAKVSKSSLNPNSANTESSRDLPKKIPPIAPPKPSSYRFSQAKTPIDFAHSVEDIPNAVHNDPSTGTTGESKMNDVRRSSSGRDRQHFFTRDPNQLVGEKIQTILLKSSRGLGFTIVGGDDDDGLDEFLQIKSVVTDGPAWRDGKLRTGDVLVRVNGRCVLGYTHQEMVSIFQSIGAGDEVELEVCRGYPLPFDPADPNTEIVTTVAVNPVSNDNSDTGRMVDWSGRIATPDSLAHSAHSLPELSGDRVVYGKAGAGRPASVDLLLDASPSKNEPKTFPKHLNFESGVFLTLDIIKGTSGFGFTIADSVAGQKVKKVLDSTHCGGLEEGDRLIAIDGIDLRGLSHTQVVQVLKEFPLGRSATLTIQRVHAQPVYSNNNDRFTGNLINHKSSIIPRSKTPTADLGRTRPRLRDTLPERPKTPSLDSSGHFNGHGENFNEFQHPNATLMHQQNSNAFIRERFSTTSAGMPSNEPNFAPSDLTQMPVIRDWIEMTIELQRRQEGFGFRIIGGTEEGSQVSVGHIVPRGAAYLDGRLQTNDHLVAVDGVSVIGASHHTAVQLMSRAAANGRVRLSIRRPIYAPIPPSNDLTTVALAAHSPVAASPHHLTLRRQPTEGFGFVIISSATKAGATIGRIVEGSPADRCGQIHVGDRILAVNQVDISQLHHSQVVQLIKDSGLVLTLSVLPVLSDEMSSNATQSLQHSPGHVTGIFNNEFDNLAIKPNQAYDSGSNFIENQPVQFNSTYPMPTYQDNLPEQIFAVQLNRGNRGFGFSIRGGKEFQNMPLFVLRLADDGPAATDGRMQVGDQILQINGVSTQNMTHSQAIHIIKTGESTVHLLLRRFPYNQIPNFVPGMLNGQEEEQSISSNNDPQQFISQNSPMYRDSHGP